MKPLQFFVLILCMAIAFIPGVCLPQETRSPKPEILPEPFGTFPNRKPYNALQLGPGNTFSIGKTPTDFTLTEFSISPNGRLLALGWESGRVELWDLQTKQRLSEFRSDLGVPLTMQFNAEATQLFLAGAKGRISSFEVPTGKKLRGWRMAQGKRKYDIQELVLDPGGKWLAYANGDNSKVMDLTADPPAPLADLGVAGSITLSQDGGEMWTVDREILERFSTSTWQKTGRWPLKSEPLGTSPVVVRAGVSPDGQPSVAVPSVKGLVIYQGDDMLGEYATDKASSGVAFSRAGAIYVNLSGTLAFLKASGELLCERSYGGRYGYAVNGDGQWLALSQAGRVDLWRIADLLRDSPAFK